ncbi:serine protease [Cytobacillus sp. S13-E01]|uniref:S1C family serine protease n=1 Tax=Cytobacillus sp. S13-E01 TaxID=3031326 RepID=UPI0023D7EDB7|nr:serine protease [Cytobacillus sp. S13-E01]MDF0725437.1 serine protease [Cytobacillus sp. S13-E01]
MKDNEENHNDQDEFVEHPVDAWDEEPSLEDFLFAEEDDEKVVKKKKQRATIGKLVVFGLVIALLLSGLGVWVQVFNLPSLAFIKKSNELSQIENIQNYKEAVVTIEGNNVKGTGFNISADGFIVTNHHVIEDLSSILVIFPKGEFFTAKVKKTYPDIDIALLEIEGTNLPYLELQKNDNWSKNDHIYVIGNPLAYSQIVMEGNILGVTNTMRISAPIHKGNSGSPVIDSDGKVIGVVYAKTIPTIGSGEESVGLAVPIDQISDLPR